MIIKTLQPENYDASAIVSQPSGNNPYTLVAVTPEYVYENNLQVDVVEDTAAFFAQYDLNEGNDDESGNLE
jgi:hypothetical protein